MAAALVLSMLGGCAEGTGEEREIVVKPQEGTLLFSCESGKDNAPDEQRYETPEAMLEAMIPAVDNGSFQLYVNTSNLNVAVRDARSGQIYSAYPYNAESCGVSGNAKTAMLSQLSLQYYDTANKTDTFNAYEDCVKLGQYAIYTQGNSLSLRMVLGEEEGSLLVPVQLPAFRFDEILSAIDEKDAASLKRYYKLYSLNDAGDKAGEYKDRFKAITSYDIYAVRSITIVEEKRVDAILRKAGYTYETMLEDYALLQVEHKENPARFYLTMVYTLTEDGVEIRIPAEYLAYDSKAYTLYQLSLSPYFGAAFSEAEKDGFVLFPDGSGTLIDFGDTASSSDRMGILTQELYGYDAAMDQDADVDTLLPSRLPVFGLKRGENGYLAVIGEGDALASVTACVGGIYGKYHTAYAGLTYAKKGQIQLEAKPGDNKYDPVYKFDSNAYAGDFAVRYHLIAGGADLPRMAQIYRDELIRQGMAGRGGQSPALMLHTLGGVRYADNVLGIPVIRTAAMTAFDENRAIVEALRAEGVTAVNLQLTGWQKGGLANTHPGKLRVLSELGGEKGLTALRDWCGEEGVGLYPDVDLLFLKTDELLDGFSARNDAVHRIDGRIGGVADFYPSTGLLREITFRTAVSPRIYPRLLEEFFTAYQKRIGGALSLSTVGEYLNSDFKKDNRVNRVQSRQLLREALSGKEAELLLSGCNGWALPYAARITGLPMEGNHIKGTTRSVPFYQMVIHGALPYASTPLNTAADFEEAVLRCVETGSDPAFTVAWKDAEYLKAAGYTGYMMVDYVHLRDKMRQAYEAVSAALSGLETRYITGYNRLTEDVVQVTYEGGVRILVNYGTAAYQGEAGAVGARSWSRLEGGAA